MGGLKVRRWRAGIALAAGAVVGAALGSGGTAGADELLRFSASATADGGRLAFIVPGASVSDQIIDGGGPVARADIDSLGASRAFASQPYPGELGVIGPGIVASLVGAPQPPPYPFIAASRHPGTPEQKVEFGPGYRLAASSDATSSAATAATGGAQGETRILASEAKARVAKESALVSAEASNRFEAITAGPLRIASVVSSAVVSRVPDAEAQRQSSLVVSGVTVNGQTVGFSDQGFVTGENATPLPSSDPLLAALDKAGVAISYLKAETTPSGIVAPGLRIVTVQAVPGSQQTATVALTLGRASASVEASTESVGLPSEQGVSQAQTNEVSASPVEAGEVPTAITPASPVLEAAAVMMTDPLTARAGPPITSAPLVSEAVASEPVASEPVATASELAAPVPSFAEQASRPARRATGIAVTKPIDAGLSFYPLLVLAGALVFGGLQAARLTGGTQ